MWSPAELATPTTRKRETRAAGLSIAAPSTRTTVSPGTTKPTPSPDSAVPNAAAARSTAGIGSSERVSRTPAIHDIA